MKLLVFGKKRQTKDGRNFTAYVTKMTKRNGDELTATVKFREECGAPSMEETPCYIQVEKSNANLATKKREVTDEETGEIKEVNSHTLWVTAWEKLDEKFVDTSLDEFDD